MKYKKERVILSDVLPFEMPIIFSNRYFYRFLVRNGVEIKDNILFWKIKNKQDREVIGEVIKLLFGLSVETKLVKQSFDLNKCRRRIPFTYKIVHKENEFRELSLIHPKNQVDIVRFYDKYKELILYYCSQSRYSLRKPADIAKYVFFNDKLHKQKIGSKEDSLEVYVNEYEHLKTFFSYKKYTNIFRFYEDYRYQRAEKKYDNLLTFDISKCFDSIYTHSISWALLNKEMVKDNIPLSEKTFAGEFDTLMQDINYGETNGILIGPEFSRIFAELILQQVDKSVENQLIKQEIIFGRDYECYRYVDDYFLFYNDDKFKDEIFQLVKFELKKFKMWVSDSKTHFFSKPIITNLTMAKLKIVDLLDSSIKFNIEDSEKREEEALEIDIDEDSSDRIEDKFTIFLNPNKLAAKFKTILIETKTTYKDVLNYTLMVISRKIERIFNKFDKKFKQYSDLEVNGKLNEEDSRKKYNIEKRLTQLILNLLDFIFFLYTVCPRVNSTIKLTRILSNVIDYYKETYAFDKKVLSKFRSVNKDLIFKKIQDEIRLILEKNKLSDQIQLETLYLLIILKELGEEYELPKLLLCKYFNMKQDDSLAIKIESKLNYFSITVLLYCISDRSRYDDIRKVLLEEVLNKIKAENADRRRLNTECIVLLFDILSCPYVDIPYKKELLSLFGIFEENTKDKLLKFSSKQQYWFVKWSKIDLRKELNAKISQEVYS